MKRARGWWWILLPIVLVAAVATVRGVFVRRDVQRELGDDLWGPLRIAEVQVDAWVREQLTRAELAAGMVAIDRAPGRFDAIARVAAEGDGYAGAWLDSSGRADSASLSRVVTRACGAAYCAEVHAPVHVEDGAVSSVVLRALIDDRTFTRLNAATRSMNGRTSLLARQGDSVVVLATGSRDTVPIPNRRLALAELPPHVRAAFDGKAARGVAERGIVYDRVLYATASRPALQWVLVREMSAYELAESILAPLAIEIAFVSAMFIFAFAYVRSRLREAGMQREQELARVRSDFLAGASHELRTPLAQIRMFAELLRKGSLDRPGEADRALGIIEKEASRLSILVENVLNYARLRRRATTQAVTGTAVATDIARDVEQVVMSFAPLAAERGARVISAVEDAPNALVDSQALRQVLLNFLENAVKYGPPGQTITVGASREGDRVCVWVDDEGPGVAESERADIWNAFHRGHSAERSGQGGSGIGLAVVRDLVLQHGGSVSVDGAPGGGARFLVEFPAA
ncbi:MAG TPA: HAMP domain-containing sensor histidine kinase [Gemmatimonadaceae bacterium]|nr:HAMP domain-containing sensor histidine kinase [Gemmatimonadaceae bacterium]